MPHPAPAPYCKKNPLNLSYNIHHSRSRNQASWFQFWFTGSDLILVFTGKKGLDFSWRLGRLRLMPLLWSVRHATSTDWHFGGKVPVCALIYLQITMCPLSLLVPFESVVGGRGGSSCCAISHVTCRGCANVASIPSSHWAPCPLGQDAVSDTRLNTKC